MMQTRGRLFGALAVLTVIVIGLHVLGSTAELSLAEWRSWSDETADLSTGILRLLALMLSYYLIAVILAMLVLGDRVEGHRFERLIPYGMFATLGLVASVGALNIATSDSGAVTAQGASPLTLQPTVAPLTLQDANSIGIARGTDAASNYTPFGASDDDLPDVEGLRSAADTWVVKAGESMWSIAQETLQDAWGVEDLTDEEIVTYWKPLTEANEGRFVDPGNPDLILPDQELLLPQPPDRAP